MMMMTMMVRVRGGTHFILMKMSMTTIVRTKVWQRSTVDGVQMDLRMKHYLRCQKLELIPIKMPVNGK